MGQSRKGRKDREMGLGTESKREMRWGAEMGGKEAEQKAALPVRTAFQSLEKQQLG